MMNNKRALINNPNKKEIHLETAQHSFSYDTIFEENKLGLKLVATKGEAEILVDWISNTSEHALRDDRRACCVSGHRWHRRPDPPELSSSIKTGQTTDCQIATTLVDHILATIVKGDGCYSSIRPRPRRRRQ